MKKHIMIFAAALVVIMTAMPALAEVELKYGGQFRTRFQAQDNVFDGTEQPFSSAYNSNDNRVDFDQRLRMFFNFVASANLHVIARFEMGDTTWGWGNAQNGVRVAGNSGGNVGADTVGIEMKNIFMEFNIPISQPIGVVVGMQPINLLDSWLLADDLCGIIATTRWDPFKFTLGYVAAQKGFETTAGDKEVKFAGWRFNIDDLVVAVDYKRSGWTGTLALVWQDAGKTAASVDPTTLNTPISSSYVGTPNAFIPGLTIDSNNLFNLGLNIGYKEDWGSFYVNFMKNLGSVDFLTKGPAGEILAKSSADYQGWMVDAGLTYIRGDLTFNIGGFYTSGPMISSNPADNIGPGPFYGLSSKNVDWFVQNLGVTKMFSEIIGGGLLNEDSYVFRGYKGNTPPGQIGFAGYGSVYWRGYEQPSNLWNVNVGGAWQINEMTKLSAAYYYWGTSEPVPVQFDTNTLLYSKMSSSIGHEFNVYLDRKIVDGLVLTLVGAYLIADDAFAPLPTEFGSVAVDSSLRQQLQAANAYELGAQLMWRW